jgi:virginiamycin B lyase
VLVVVVALIVIGGAVSFFALIPPLKSTGTGTTQTTTSTTSSAATTCPAVTPVKDGQLTGTTFDAVTEFTLPSPARGPNAVAVAPDGSIWFGENGLPGIGHLFPNGTLTEYALPFTYDAATSSCNELTQLWGVALWNGSAWAVNEDSSQLLGVNPSTGGLSAVTLESQANPYTLTVGPDNHLWFTQIFDGPKIGRVSPGNYSIQYYKLPGNSSWSSAYIVFQNSTRGYVLTINPDLTVYANAVISHLYAFDPQLQNPTFQQVGGNVSLYAPSSVAVGEGGIWVTEHSASSMGFFNTTSSKWTIYPTSTVPYVPWTLTYFDVANGSAVWFNEHYGNKIGVIYDGATRLTEYSVDDPPMGNFTTILSDVNTLTVGLGANRLWFTQWSAGVVGFVNTSYSPPFSISSSSATAGGANSTITIPAGGSAQLKLQLSGQSSSNLSLQFSDNEFNNGTAKSITFTPSVESLQSLSGTEAVTLNVSVASGLVPGEYVAAITLTSGLILSSVYVTIVVTG